MKTFVNSGEDIVFTAPRALVAGDGFQVGVVVAVALGDAANGAQVVGKRLGRVTLPVNPADTPTVGALLYWDNTAFRLTTTASTNKLVGFAATTKSAANTVEAVLTGQVA